MKVYEKPRLMALSLSGNDQLCGSCGDSGYQTIYNDPLIQEDLLLFGDSNVDGSLSRAEANNLFGQHENCGRPVTSYCKFTSAEESLPVVAWS